LVLYSHIRGPPRFVTRKLKIVTTQITPNTHYYTYVCMLKENPSVKKSSI